MRVRLPRRQVATVMVATPASPVPNRLIYRIRQLTPMCPHLIYFGPLESTPRTAPRSVHPLLQDSRSRLTDKHTTVRRDICSNSPRRALSHVAADVYFTLYTLWVKGKGNPYSITERMVPELIPVLGSQPVGDVSHKSDGRLLLLFARPAVTLATLKRAVTSFVAW